MAKARRKKLHRGGHWEVSLVDNGERKLLVVADRGGDVRGLLPVVAGQSLSQLLGDHIAAPEFGEEPVCPRSVRCFPEMVEAFADLGERLGFEVLGTADLPAVQAVLHQLQRMVDGLGDKGGPQVGGFLPEVPRTLRIGPGAALIVSVAMADVGPAMNALDAIDRVSLTVDDELVSLWFWKAGVADKPLGIADFELSPPDWTPWLTAAQLTVSVAIDDHVLRTLSLPFERDPEETRHVAAMTDAVLPEAEAYAGPEDTWPNGAAVLFGLAAPLLADGVGDRESTELRMSLAAMVWLSLIEREESGTSSAWDSLDAANDADLGDAVQEMAATFERVRPFERRVFIVNAIVEIDDAIHAVVHTSTYAEKP